MKILKGINFIKVPKVKDPYELYIVTKGKASEYKSYIYFKKYLLDLVHSNIIRPFNYSYKGEKYFITFLNNYNKRLEMEILESKSNIYSTYQRFIARNKRGDIKIRHLKINYSGEYSNYNFNNFRAN